MPPAEPRDIRDRLVRLEERLKGLEQKVTEIRNLIRWIGVTVGGAVLLAATQWILNGGLGTAAKALGQ